MTAIELSGDVALVAIFLLTLNLILGLLLSVRFHPRQHWPHRPVNLFKVHNWTGYLALATAILHPVLLLFSTTAGFRPLDLIYPIHSPSQPIENTLGALALYLVALVVVTSYYRVELGRRRWKRLHYCAYAAAALFFVHGLLTDPRLQNSRFDPLDAEKVFVETCLGFVVAGVMLRIRYAMRVSLIVALVVAVGTSVSAQSSTEPADRSSAGWRYDPAAGLVYERGDFKWITWGFAERLFNPTGRATWRRVRQGMEFDLPRFSEKYRNAFVYEVDLTNNDFFRVGQRRRVLENLFLTIQDADDASAFRVLLGENTHILSREDNQSSGNLPTINRSLILEEHGSVNAFGTQFGVQLQKVLSPRYTFALSAQDNRGSFNQDRPRFVIGNSLAAKVTTLAVRDDARGRRLTFGAAIDHTRDVRDRTFTLSSAIAQDALGGTSASGNKLTLEGDATYAGRIGASPFTLEVEGLQSSFSQSRTRVIGGYALAQVRILNSKQTGTVDPFARYDVVRLSRQGIDGRASQQATRVGLNYNLPYARQLANVHIEFADNQISGPAAMVRTPRSFDEVRIELRVNLTQYARR